jgi:hypothetical protein
MKSHTNPPWRRAGLLLAAFLLLFSSVFCNAATSKKTESPPTAVKPSPQPSQAATTEDLEQALTALLGEELISTEVSEKELRLNILPPLLSETDALERTFWVMQTAYEHAGPDIDHIVVIVHRLDSYAYAVKASMADLRGLEQGKFDPFLIEELVVVEPMSLPETVIAAAVRVALEEQGAGVRLLAVYTDGGQVTLKLQYPLPPEGENTLALPLRTLPVALEAVSSSYPEATRVEYQMTYSGEPFASLLANLGEFARMQAGEISPAAFAAGLESIAP